MAYQNPHLAETADLLKKRFAELDNKADILKAVELKALFDELKTMPQEEKAGYGQAVNQLRQELVQMVSAHQNKTDALPPIDISAPFALNTPLEKRPHSLPTEQGSQHPLMTELQTVLDIFYRMGFNAVESRELDDDYHMFSSLNFPEGHPARDDYDTFVTSQTDSNGKPLIAPAHTSTMQNRVLKKYRSNLEKNQSIAVVIPGRCFRNEDLDVQHEHTFYQLEGVYVGKGIHAGNLFATLKAFLEEYYATELEIKIQPFYFPFTEPSFEYAMSCPFCHKKGCSVCLHNGWIELLGCGMIHPNVLREAGIDPDVYSGFAWGGGIDRLIMMKHGVEDIRYFESAKLDFLRQFS